MKIIKTYSFLIILVLLSIVACSSSSAVKKNNILAETSTGVDGLKFGKSKQSDIVNNAQQIKPTNIKSIVVTDISYSIELKDAFYFEETKIKSSVFEKDSNQDNSSAESFNLSASEIKEKEPTEKVFSKNSQKEMDNQALTGPQVRFMAGNNNASGDENNPVINKLYLLNNNKIEFTNTKKYGVERKINYSEIRGLSGSIKGMLLRAGFKVVQGKPNVARIDQNDDYFDIIKRIEAGDFGEAHYVLFGVLTSLSQNTHSSQIVGTSNLMLVNDLQIAIDFSLIDTLNHQVVASFIASGLSTDNRIDGESEGYKPNVTKMFKELSSSLADDVANHLSIQNFVSSQLTHDINNPRIIPGTNKHKYDEHSLKVFK